MTRSFFPCDKPDGGFVNAARAAKYVGFGWDSALIQQLLKEGEHFRNPAVYG